jgi:zinc transport system substrate-binding protein
MRLLLSFLFSISLLACSESENAQPGDVEVIARPLVVTSNYPLHFFASQIAGDGVDAPQIVLPEIDGDPAFWVPTASDIELLQSADFVLLNGAGYESWLDWITLDGGNLIDTSAGISDQLIELEGTLTHQHGPAGEHAHQGTAFTTWLNPQLAMKQAESIASALESLAPEQAGVFRKNLTILQTRLAELDAQLTDTFAALDGQPTLFSHPVYQYLQRCYDINGISLHWEPDVEPGISDWIDLQKILQQHPATIMLWEDEPLSSTAARLTELGVQPIVFHTAANRPRQGDYFDLMQINESTLEGMTPPPNQSLD